MLTLAYGAMAEENGSRIDRLELLINPPPPEKCVVVFHYDDETDPRR